MTAPGVIDFLRAKEMAVRSRRRLAAARTLRSDADAVGLPNPPSFREALREGPHVALIAEFKRRSPSAGALTAERPEAIARQYAEHGARAISVLTDADDFGGSLEDLTAAADASALPALRKDFIVDEDQLVEARAAGAAAVLLIVAMLKDRELGALLRAADQVQIETLVEVRDAREAERAAALGARTIGVNRRDLRTLVTDHGTIERVARLLPAGTTVVTESGIGSADDVARARDAGSHAVLVGEALLRRSPESRESLVRELATVPR
jgi:indole-3-glycerol phosphate synthase